MQLNLRVEREQRNWSRARLARELGTSEYIIAQWEDGLSQPSPLFRQALAVLFERPDPLATDLAALRTEQHELAFLLLPSSPMTQTVQTRTHPYSKRTSSDISVQDKLYDPVIPGPFPGSHHLIGRARLLRQLKQHLLTYRNLALHGLPGVGKTALAVALAHDMDIRNLFTDGVLWADLGIHSRPSGVFRRWSSLIGVAPPEEDTRDRYTVQIQTLKETLRNLRLLLILDDVWQIEAIEQLQIAGPDCGYIVTTRFAHIAARLTGNTAMRIPELADDDGVQLLTRYLPEVSQQEHDTALTLVRAVGGLPLALTLMSKYLGSNAYMRQPRRLHAALSHLQDAERRLCLQFPSSPAEASPVLSSESKLSIASVIAVSDHNLPEQAQQALRALAILPPKPTTISQATALAVTGATPETLTVLCDAGLLDQHSTGAYMLHTLIADYARSQGIELEAHLRLVQYAHHFIQDHQHDMLALEAESAILLAALAYAWEQNLTLEFIQSALLFIPFLLKRGWYTQAEQILQRLLPITRSCDHLQVLEYLSTLAYLQGHYALTQQYSARGLELAQQHQDQQKITSLLSLLGSAAYEQGNYTLAEHYCQKGFQLARKHGAAEHICTLLLHLAMLATRQQQTEQARLYLQEGLHLAHQLEHPIVHAVLKRLPERHVE